MTAIPAPNMIMVAWARGVRSVAATVLPNAGGGGPARVDVVQPSTATARGRQRVRRSYQLGGDVARRAGGGRAARPGGLGRGRPPSGERGRCGRLAYYITSP